MPIRPGAGTLILWGEIERCLSDTATGGKKERLQTLWQSAERVILDATEKITTQSSLDAEICTTSARVPFPGLQTRCLQLRSAFETAEQGRVDSVEECGIRKGKE